MTIAVTAATGQLGRLVVSALIERGVPAPQVVAIGRSAEKLAEFAPLGVQTRVADYSDPTALAAAFEGVEKALLISGSEMGQRLPQHRNVIDAAQGAGVQLLAYTSVINADTSSLSLAPEHVGTEQLIVKSGLPHTILRNGWYTENYTDQLAVQLEHGAVIGAAGEGKVSAATRLDLAEAAAAALTAEAPAALYELGGPAFTVAEYAAAVTEVTGTPVAYADLGAEGYGQALIGAGVPEQYIDFLVSSDLGLAQGDLQTDSDALEQLIGRPATPLVDAVRAAQA